MRLRLRWMALRGLLLLAVLLLGSVSLVQSQPEGAAHTWTVCPEGCDYSSIQAAIDAAELGAIIAVGSGEYLESLVIQKPLTLQGSGRGETILEGGIGIYETHDVWIKGFTIKDGIDAQKSSAITIRDNELSEEEGTHLGGIYIIASSTITVMDNIISNGVILLVASGLLYVKGNEISRGDPGGIYIGSFDDYACFLAPHLAGPTVAAILQNTITEAKGVGIAIDRWYFELRVEIRENIIVTTGNGIMAYGDLVMIDNNTIASNIGNGIIANSYGLRVRGNRIRENGERGLWIQGGGTVAVLDNVISDNRGDGLVLFPPFGEAEIRIKGNEITGNGGWGLAGFIPECFSGEIHYQDTNYRFETVIGGENVIPDSDDPNGNKKGDICPKDLAHLKG